MLTRTQKQCLVAAMMISLFAYIGGEAGAFTVETPVTICEHMISVAPNEGVQAKDLPASIEFSISQEQSRQYFDLAEELYQKRVRLPELSTLLKQIDKGSIARLSPSDVARLKTIRKYSLVMRNSFSLFDASHEVPKTLDRVVTDLGHLNDEIELGDAKGAQKQAHDLRGEVDALEDFDLPASFKPAKRGSSVDHLDDQIELLRKYLDKKKIKAAQFHKIRKVVKELMDIYLFKTSLAEDAEESVSDQKVYSYLYELSKDMGLVHDDLVAKDHHGEIDYDDYELSVPARIRARITALLSRIDS